MTFRLALLDKEESMLSLMKCRIERLREYIINFAMQVDIFTSSFRSLVSFGPKQRAIGEAAKTQEISNFKNTIGSLKRLIGRTLNDVEIQEVERKFINAKLVDVQGTVGVQVSTLPMLYLRQ